MLEAGGRIIDAGRKSRVVPAALKRALVSRDGGCRFPGCDHRLVDAHHVEHLGQRRRDGEGESALALPLMPRAA
jgi:hypothetical protein